MGTTLLNELFQEAIGRCETLAQQAQEASDTVDTVLDRGRRLGERVAEESRQADAHFQQLEKEAATTQSSLTDGVAQARERLDHVHERAEEVSAEADQLLEGIEKGVDGFRSAREESASELEHASEEAEAKLADLEGQVHELEQSIKTRTQEAFEDVGELLEAAAALRRALPEAFLGLHTDLEELEEVVAGAVDEVLDAFDESMAAQLTAFRGLGAALVEEHNRAVQAFATGLIEETVGAIKGAIEPLRRATEELEQLAETGAGELEGRFADITRALDAVGAELERIQPALLSVAELK
jgi:uncharacterized phage infection (PIP) family protein YhgE